MKFERFLVKSVTRVGLALLVSSSFADTRADLDFDMAASAVSSTQQTEDKSSQSDEAPQTSKASSDAMPPPRQLAEDRTSRATARAKGDLTFDDLKFEIEKGGEFHRSMLTEEIEELNKREIRIRGFILPASVFKLTGITEFVLVRDNMECCFGPGAALYDCIIVHMAKGKTADFSTRPVTARGKFEIREFKYPESDQHYAIYFMTATEVK